MTGSPAVLQHPWEKLAAEGAPESSLGGETRAWEVECLGAAAERPAAKKYTGLKIASKDT